MIIYLVKIIDKTIFWHECPILNVSEVRNRNNFNIYSTQNYEYREFTILVENIQKEVLLPISTNSYSEKWEQIQGHYEVYISIFEEHYFLNKNLAKNLYKDKKKIIKEKKKKKWFLF